MSEEEIIAYVDDELSPIDRLRFERAIEGDPALAAAVERHRALRAVIGGNFAPVAEEPVPARLSALLDRDDTVVPFPARRRAPKSFAPSGRIAALAATLVAGIVVGNMLAVPSAPVVERGGQLMAQGELARTLDRKLVSEEGGSDYRIGVSFVSAGHRYCRTFTGGAGAGIGCHGPSGWTLERFAAVTEQGRGEYRQAGSADQAIMAAAQDMMAGDPLDAAGERAARDAGWTAR